MIRQGLESFASGLGFVLGVATLAPMFYLLALYIGAVPACLR